MAGGVCASLAELPERARAIVSDARRGVLVTVGASGAPNAVPVCFAVRSGEIVTAVDDKPKSGRPLARLASVETTPGATVLLDRWDEDWTKLGWVMVKGTARLDAPGSASAELAARYVQYRDRPPGGPVIAVRPHRVVWWTWE
jgi:PPOX class probable F420-dependent enzyme